MSSIDTTALVGNLLAGFREIVVSLEDENNLLKANIKSFDNRSRNHSNCKNHQTTRQQNHRNHHHQQHQQQSTSSSLNTNSSSNEPQSITNTLSSATLPTSSNSNGTTSTKPPPYKSVVRIAPLPPARTRRKQYLQQEDSTSVAEAAAFPPININTRRYHTMGSRGALIVLEGLDRVGKSTLARKLVEHFQRTHTPVAYCRFPDRSTQIGRLIDGYLKDNSAKVDDHVLHLLFSANRWEISSKIRNTIMSGTTMVVDRYSYSGIAYSSAKSSVPMEWCRETERGLPKPDLVIYLELPVEAQVGRSGYGEERFETSEFQESARRQYQHVMNMSQETWLKIDVDHKTVDQILGEIIVPVKRCLESCASKSLGYLDFL